MTDQPTTTSPRKYLVCMSNNEASRVALKLACIKARHHGGTVSVLYVVPPADNQILFTIVDRHKDEQRGEAEKFLSAICEEAFSMTGIMAEIHIREGRIGEEIVKTVAEDQNIMLLVMGLSGSQISMNLIEWLTGQMGKKLFIPIMVTPSDLTDQQIEEIA